MSSESLPPAAARALIDHERRKTHDALSKLSKKALIDAGAGMAMEAQELRERLHIATQQLANMAAILEGVVAKHGEQRFTREQLEGEFREGKVELVINPTTEQITIRAKAERPKLHAVQRDEGAQIIEDAVKLANDTRLVT